MPSHTSRRSGSSASRVRSAARLLPEEPGPVLLGVHGAVAKHYGVDMDGREAPATALDYVVAAAAG